MPVNRRTEYINELLEYPTNLNDIISHYTDEETPEGEYCSGRLTRSHIISMLERYLAGTITASDVQNWADQIGLTGDVQYEKGYCMLHSNLMYLAHEPHYGRPLTPSQAREQIQEIKAISFDQKDFDIETALENE